jgi:tetratricopeptide (TPR) repeat protein
LVQAGAVAFGRYRVERLAGAGGMGTVYRVVDLETGLARALKVLLPDATQRTRERFRVEAAALAKLSHPAIVRYVDHGDDYLVMEWVDGESLADRISHLGTPPADALRLGARLVAGLAAAHAAGVVHRDVKPRNVMLPNGSFEEAKLVDFGVARVEAAGHTRTGVRVGTPRYMAPEQIVSSRRVDGRADVFSLGCVLFEMLAGRKAFRGRDEVALLARMVIEDAPRLRSVRADVPEEVDALVATMLARDYKKRPFANDALLADIEDAIAHLGDLAAARAEKAEMESTADDSAVSILVELPLDSTGIEPLPPPSELPWDTIGRDAELAALERMLAPGAVASLWGAFGVGKTHVAQALARHLWRTRGSIVCDLHGAHDEAEIARRVAAELGVLHAANASDVSASLAARHGAVVVLDACDAHEAAVAFGKRVVAESPESSVLVVARENPGTREALELAPLDATNAVKLLVARSRGAASLERDHVELEKIAAALQGNALALTLAASRTSVLGVAAVAARATRPLEVLGATLRNAAEEVWETLTEAERAVAEACAIFPSAIRPEIAEKTRAAVATDALDVLQALREKSILRAGARGTLVMDATLRELARTKRTDALARAEHAFARETLAAVPADLAERFVFEEDLLVAAEIAIGIGDANLALGATIELEASLVARGPLDRLASLLDRAIAIAAPSRLRARAHGARGRTATLARDFAIADRSLQEALDSAKALGDEELEASTWLDLGVMHQSAGDFAAAERCYTAVLEVHDTIASRSEARARGNLGALAHDRGDLDAAYAHYVRAIAVAESIGEPRLLGVFLSNLAVLAVLDRERGHVGSARQRFVRALRAIDESHDQRLQGMILGNVGMLDLEENRLAVALASFERSAEMLAALGDVYSAALACARLAAAHALAGDVARSEAAIARAEKLAARDEKTLAVVRFFRAFPEAARAAESGDASRALLERARARRTSAVSLASHNDDVRVALRLLARLGVE